MGKSKKGHGELIIACSDPAKNFKFIEEALNQVALLSCKRSDVARIVQEYPPRPHHFWPARAWR